MNLPASAQQVVDNIIDEAHLEHEGVARDVAVGIVEKMQALEGSGVLWVATYLDSILVNGAARMYADWRRRYEVAGKTKVGTEVSVPAFGGVTRKAEDGSTVHVQMSLRGMSLADLREMRDRKASMRDTLSAEIKVYDALIELMQDYSLSTAGEALDLMAVAA